MFENGKKTHNYIFALTEQKTMAQDEDVHWSISFVK